MKIDKHRSELLRALEYFDTQEWSFRRHNVAEMTTKVKTLGDGNAVKLDLQDMDWKQYITNYQVGMKKFILKENSESIKATRRLSLYVFRNIFVRK